MELNEHDHVVKTAEKKVISDKACVGIYYFKSGALFCANAREMIERDLRTNNEFYITPLYNLLLEKKLKITTKEVSKICLIEKKEGCKKKPAGYKKKNSDDNISNRRYEIIP